MPARPDPVRRARAGAALLLFVIAPAWLACATGTPHGSAPAEAGDVAAPDRQVIRTGDMSLTVDAPVEAQRVVEHVVADVGGFVERSTSTRDESVWMTCRVPADSLDAVMQRVSELGDVERSVVSTTDVTDEVEDLEARLANDVALRDRLRALLERAEDVDDVLTVERQLTRVQSEIDRMEARLARLRSQVAHSALTISLGRGQKLGPLGWVGYGLYWGVAKLFVIR